MIRAQTPGQLHSGLVARIGRVFAKAVTAHEWTDLALGTHIGVSDTSVQRYRDHNNEKSTLPFARFWMLPRPVMLEMLRDLLGEHHAVVVDLLAFGQPGQDPDATVMRELDAAQMGSARVLHEILAAITPDRVIDSGEATTIRHAIRAVVEPLMALDRRMERIERNGPEGIGRAGGTH